MTRNRAAIERVLDLTVYAPVGLLLTVRDRFPAQVRQGRQAMENRVQLARFIGRLAVRQGQLAIERRADAVVEARPVAMAPITAVVAVPEPAVPTAATPPATPPPPATTVTAADLPIDGYENLAAIHVVARLGSLTPGELELVLAFELAHRARRTILAKIAQLDPSGTGS